MIPKRPRIVDPNELKRFRMRMLNEPCDDCGLRPGIHVHHKVFRSQGGHDIASNFSWLCGICHDAAHGIVRVEL